jgi:hypothetical protein
VDPLTASYPFYTPYQFAGNSPIYNIDLDGLEDTPWAMSSEGRKLYGEVHKVASENFSNIRLIPLPLRAIIWNVTDAERAITESDLTAKELKVLRDLAIKALASGRKFIDYPDYKTAKGQDPLADVASNLATQEGEDSWSIFVKGFTDTKYTLKTTLGRAGLVVEGGEYFVVDTYNFNDDLTEDLRSQLEDLYMPIPSPLGGVIPVDMRTGLWYYGFSQAGFNPYKQARNVGRWYGSLENDGEGSPVRINIGQIAPEEIEQARKSLKKPDNKEGENAEEK